MDTSFWDDAEDKVKIVYQDDQPPMQPPQEHAVGSGSNAVLKAQFVSELLFNGLLV